MAVSSYGIVSAWETKKFNLIYRENAHFNSTIQGIKAFKDIFITGDVDGRLNVFKVEENQVKILANFEDERHPVNHLDFDGRWILTGSRNNLKVWNAFIKF